MCVNPFHKLSEMLSIVCYFWKRLSEKDQTNDFEIGIKKFPLFWESNKKTDWRWKDYLRVTLQINKQTHVIYLP